jgi:membrane-associated phospholipid phosphatase
MFASASPALAQGTAPPRSVAAAQPLTLFGEALADIVQPDVGGSGEQPQAEKPPEPAHTGFGALIRTTASDFAAFPRRGSTYVILGVGAAAAALAHPIDDEVNAKLQGSVAVRRLFAPGRIIGNGGVQVGAAVGTYLIGRYVMAPTEGQTNKVSHIGFDLLRAVIVSQALTFGMKQAFRRDRPTGECCSFPSGHASVTFATASVLERHFGYRGTWPTFAIAGYVAASRLHDNRHFLSDVVFGSALGVASGWTVVGRHGRDNYAVLPVPTRGGAMVMVTRKPSDTPASCKAAPTCTSAGRRSTPASPARSGR